MKLKIPLPCLIQVHMLYCFRVVDVGTEWRTFSNDKSDKDPSRVGAAEVRNLLNQNYAPPNRRGWDILFLVRIMSADT